MSGLILTRHEHESIIITTPTNETITISIDRINNSTVSIRTQAPAGYNIARDELLERGNALERHAVEVEADI